MKHVLAPRTHLVSMNLIHLRAEVKRKKKSPLWEGSRRTGGKRTQTEEKSGGEARQMTASYVHIGGIVCGIQKDVLIEATTLFHVHGCGGTWSMGRQPVAKRLE